MALTTRRYRNNLFWRLDRGAIERVLAETPDARSFAFWAEPNESGGHTMTFSAYNAEARLQEERDKVPLPAESA